MKKLLLIFSLLSLQNILFAQFISPSQMTNEDVIKVDSVSKTNLCKRASAWITQVCTEYSKTDILESSPVDSLKGKMTFRYEVIVNRNKEDITSIANKRIEVDVYVTVSIQILCKDFRYKYRIQIEGIKQKVTENYVAVKSEVTKKKIQEEANKKNIVEINKIVQSLKEYMTHPVENIDNKDW
jgi:hypothetical protein